PALPPSRSPFGRNRGPRIAAVAVLLRSPPHPRRGSRGVSHAGEGCVTLGFPTRHERGAAPMRYLTAVVLALGLTVAVPPPLTAQSAAAGSLVVLSKGNLTLSVVDPVTLQVRGTAPSGPDPHETAVS